MKNYLDNFSLSKNYHNLIKNNNILGWYNFFSLKKDNNFCLVLIILISYSNKY